MLMTIHPAHDAAMGKMILVFEGIKNTVNFDWSLDLISIESSTFSVLVAEKDVLLRGVPGVVMDVRYSVDFKIVDDTTAQEIKENFFKTRASVFFAIFEKATNEYIVCERGMK